MSCLPACAEVTTQLVIPTEDGELAQYMAYRVQHNNSRGPYKGGIIYHSDVNIENMRRWVAHCMAAGWRRGGEGGCVVGWLAGYPCAWWVVGGGWS